MSQFPPESTTLKPVSRPGKCIKSYPLDQFKDSPPGKGVFVCLRLS